MKKVVHIIPTLTYGGAEKFVVNLVNNSHNFKHEVVIFKDEKPFASLLEDKVDLHFVEKEGKISLDLFSKLEQKLQEINPDLVHTNLFGADLWGRIAAERLDLPVITTEHNLNKDESWAKRIVRRVLKNYSDIYTAPSKAVQRYMNLNYGVAKENIEVISHGIELSKFLRTEPFMYHIPLRFLILGRLDVQKGVDRALDAFGQLKNKEWKLDIVGEGDQFSNIKRKVKEKSLKNRVGLWDSTKDVVSEYNSHDVVVVPSRWEGFGLVALEAMASGKVVIASDVDGLSEFITNGETGFLFDQDNPIESLKDKIEFVLENKEKSIEVAENARLHAKNNFGIDQMVEKYERLYISLTRNH
ncbi:MAG: glycosyltransferase [Candidatus Magasanikbacteria bacterium]